MTDALESVVRLVVVVALGVAVLASFRPSRTAGLPEDSGIDDLEAKCQSGQAVVFRCSGMSPRARLLTWTCDLVADPNRLVLVMVGRTPRHVRLAIEARDGPTFRVRGRWLVVTVGNDVWKVSPVARVEAVATALADLDWTITPP